MTDIVGLLQEGRQIDGADRIKRGFLKLSDSFLLLARLVLGSLGDCAMSGTYDWRFMFRIPHALPRSSSAPHRATR